MDNIFKEIKIKDALKSSWISKGRRFYWDGTKSVRFSIFIWNLYNLNDKFTKGDQYKFVIHHKDGNTLNDCIDNLEKISHNRHTSLHHKGKLISEEHKLKLSKYKGEKSWSYGRVVSEETRRKISKIRIENGLSKGENNPMYNVHRFGEDNPFYGKNHTEETKSKISCVNKGKIRTEDQNKKRSEHMKSLWEQGKYLNRNFCGGKK